MPETLTSEQKKFLEECEEEFEDRFTEKDPEFKKVYDSGIPPPPIICPWTVSRRGQRGTGRRQHQSGGSRSYSNNWNEYGRKRSYEQSRDRDDYYDDYNKRRRY